MKAAVQFVCRTTKFSLWTLCFNSREGVSFLLFAITLFLHYIYFKCLVLCSFPCDFLFLTYFGNLFWCLEAAYLFISAIPWRYLAFIALLGYFVIYSRRRSILQSLCVSFCCIQWVRNGFDSSKFVGVNT